MNELRQILERFLESSTSEELRQELTKGNRPFYQTIKDQALVSDVDTSSTFSFQAAVSFYQGEFSRVELEPLRRFDFDDVDNGIGSTELFLAA